MEQELQQNIDYQFKSLNLLQKALHPAGTAPLQGSKRLALVGDSALALSILYSSYDHHDSTSK
jgi:dsRNA-specific ribonuclease